MTSYRNKDYKWHKCFCFVVIVVVVIVVVVVKNTFVGLEMAQWLRALTALLEVLSLIPATTCWLTTICNEI
jgi:predicted ferric reductase